MKNFSYYLKLFFTIICYIFAIFALIFIVYFHEISSIILLGFALLSSAMFAGIFRIVFKKLREKPFHHVMREIFVSVFAIFGFILAISSYFVYYHNVINPAKLANIALENSSGQKVVFVKMSHIATQKFFIEKNNSLKMLANENFIFLEEGVGTGSTDAHGRINELMGFDFSGLGYSRIADVFGLIEQTDELYAGINATQIKNVDLSIDKVVELIGTGSVQQEANLSEKELEITLSQLETLDEKQKTMVRQIILSILNFFIKIADEVAELNASQADENIQAKFMNVILVERNKPIVEEIIAHPHQNYAIVYGALHFNGVYKMLKEYDNTWNITKVEAFEPYSQ